jgi:predicted DCC family thiol-disulfide oxidoreductase YuxK
MTISSPESPHLKVYFDGLCSLCSREIAMYRRKPGSDSIAWIDITHAGFDATSEGLDASKVHATFHVKTAKGAVIEGVDAFIEIWKNIPSLGFLAKAAEVPGVRPLLRIGYAGFARLRPYLPRKNADACTTDTCVKGPS